MKNNFLSKAFLFFILVQSGIVIYQLYKLNIKTKYITSRSNELKIENDKWFNFVTNSTFFLTNRDRDSLRKEGLFYGLSEIDFKELNSSPNIIECYKHQKRLYPQIINLVSNGTKRNTGCFWSPSYYVFKDFYSRQYFVGNDTYYFHSFESQYYERYDLTINGEKLPWNENHLYAIPKADSLNIKLKRYFLDFQSGNLMSDEVIRGIKM